MVAPRRQPKPRGAGLKPTFRRLPDLGWNGGGALFTGGGWGAGGASGHSNTGIGQVITLAYLQACWWANWAGCRAAKPRPRTWNRPSA